MDEEKLNELIRLSREQEPGETEIPDDVLFAYLSGAATAEQKTVVRKALARSADFRAELLSLQQHIDSLSSETAKSAFDAAEAPPMPQSLRSSVEQRQAADGSSPGFFQRLASWLTPRHLAVALPAGAALLVMVSILPRFGDGKYTILHAISTDHVEPGRLILEGDPRSDGFSSHAEAALPAFSNCISLRGSTIDLDSPKRVIEDLEGGRDLNIRIVEDTSDQTVHESITVQVPKAAQLSGEDVVAWLVVIPESDNLVARRRYPVRSWNIGLPWDDPAARRGVLTVTYATTGGFAATACFPIELVRPPR